MQKEAHRLLKAGENPLKEGQFKKQGAKMELHAIVQRVGIGHNRQSPYP